MSGLFFSAVVGLAFVSASICIVIGAYFLARRIMGADTEGDRTHDVASSVAVRLAALHGLILALVYAQELDDYKGVRSGLSLEAVAVADIYNDMRRYGGASVGQVQSGLARYVALVVSEEWDGLGRRQGLLPAAWRQWDDVYEQLLNLVPANDREKFLASRMRDRATVIAQSRSLRAEAVNYQFSGLFWAPAVIGLALLAIPFYVYPPNRAHLLLLSVFGAYSGVILFFIYAFSNPFHEPGRLDPLPFEQLLQGDLGKSLGG